MVRITIRRKLYVSNEQAAPHTAHGPYKVVSLSVSVCSGTLARARVCVRKIVRFCFISITSFRSFFSFSFDLDLEHAPQLQLQQSRSVQVPNTAEPTKTTAAIVESKTKKSKWNIQMPVPDMLCANRDP